jgi:prepilin-type N-terminal cleavage/methylation domain-containing protein
MGMQPKRPGSAGYTLIELLLAMALFAALSTGLIALLARSSEFLSSGASQTETMDSLQNFAERFSSDIATVASRPDCETGRPDVRLLCDWVESDQNGDKRPDLQIQRLFFVRVSPNDAGTDLGQLVGRTPGATGHVSGIDPAEELRLAKDGKLRSSGALMEVFWTSMPDPAAEVPDGAVMQIWRGSRAPPGGKNPLIPSRSAREPQASAAERGPVDAKDVRAVAQQVLNGVLYFGVDFWSRKTTSWDEKIRVKDGGPMSTWDSTRGILPFGEDNLGTFYLSKRKTAADPGSLDDPTDDTFPRKIRVTCVVEELGRNARVGYLTEPMAADAKSIQVEDARFFPLSETSRRYVKIEGEWMEVGLPDGRTIPVLHRGVRGTEATPHAAGARVHHGRSFVAEYDVAAFRDTYRDELPTITSRAR